MTITLRRCTRCVKEWDLGDGPGPAELCSFKHEHANGWYRTTHEVDTVSIAIPDDPSGLWA